LDSLIGNAADKNEKLRPRNNINSKGSKGKLFSKDFMEQDPDGEVHSDFIFARNSDSNLPTGRKMMDSPASKNKDKVMIVMKTGN
jgi:hypothetical protein